MSGMSLAGFHDQEAACNGCCRDAGSDRVAGGVRGMGGATGGGEAGGGEEGHGLGTNTRGIVYDAISMEAGGMEAKEAEAVCNGAVPGNCGGVVFCVRAGLFGVREGIGRGVAQEAGAEMGRGDTE